MAPFTRRRSARLASNSKPTGAASTPALDALTEQIEEQPSSPMLPPPQTPASSSPVKPSKSEMRPGKANGAKAPPSSALRLGFADIDTARQQSPTTAKSNKIAASATLKFVSPEQDDTNTPFKKRSPLSAISPFTFRFSRLKGKATTVGTADEPEASTVTSPMAFSSKRAAGTPDLGLSDEARRMMEELREEAQKIRADLEVQRDKERAQAEEDEGAHGGRRIAKPKSRAGRYSAAHTAEFDKMDSIANHPSAFRISRFTPVKSTATSSSANTAATAATPALASQARGLKRTQSKANLDETPNSKPVAKTPASAAVGVSTKKYNPLFGADGKPPQSVRKGNILFPSADEERPMSAAKRIKQNMGDDASSSRPMSRDGSSLPRPAALAGSVSSISRSHTMASLLTPTKTATTSSLARSASVKAPSTASGAASVLPPKTPNKSPTKSRLQLFSALKKSATTSSLQTSVRTPPAVKEPVVEKHTVNKAKPMVRHADTVKTATVAPASQANTSAVRSVLPVPMATAIMAFSKTPAPPRMTDRVQAPRVPATTPRRKLTKRVAFTSGAHGAVLSEKSPSLFRSGIPRSALKSTTGPTGPHDVAGAARETSAGSPSFRRRFGATVFYPDLSGHELLGGSGVDSEEETVLAPSTTLAPPLPPSVPGTFTFRSDKTINFGQTSPTGFGSSPGQASVRQVRASTSVAPKIPGSFPGSSHVGDMFQALVTTDGPNKENTRPVAVSIIPHGIANKKRHRVSEEEEAAEEDQRAAKKRKNAAPVPEGDALLAPRLAGKTMPPCSANNGFVRSTPHKTLPSKTHFAKTPFSATPSASKAPFSATPGSTSAVKKRPILTMSRLNSLARPKLRK